MSYTPSVVVQLGAGYKAYGQNPVPGTTITQGSERGVDIVVVLLSVVIWELFCRNVYENCVGTWEFFLEMCGNMMTCGKLVITFTV